MKSSLDFMHDLMHSRKMKEKTERSISQFLMIMFSQFAQCNTYGKKFVSFFSFACQIRFFFFFFSILCWRYSKFQSTVDVCT